MDSFEKTFILEPDGTVISKKDVGIRFPYTTYKLRSEELRAAHGVLRAPELLKAGGMYGVLNANDLPEKDLILTSDGERVEISVIGLDRGECQLEDAKNSYYETPAPSSFVAACRLIEKLRNDPRAVPWRPERIRVTFRTELPHDKRVTGPAADWPSQIPRPAHGFHPGRQVEEYDAKYLEEFQRLVPSPHAAQRIEVEGWSGWVDYDPVIPGDDGKYRP